MRNSSSAQVELGAVCGVWVRSVGLDTDAAATSLLRHGRHRGPVKGVVMVVVIVIVVAVRTSTGSSGSPVCYIVRRSACVFLLTDAASLSFAECPVECLEQRVIASAASSIEIICLYGPGHHSPELLVKCKLSLKSKRLFIVVSHPAVASNHVGNHMADLPHLNPGGVLFSELHADLVVS